MVLVSALVLPRAPQHAEVGGLSSAALRDKMNAGGGREGFLTGTLWEKQNLMSWFTNCCLMISPRELVRRHKPAQFPRK